MLSQALKPVRPAVPNAPHLIVHLSVSAAERVDKPECRTKKKSTDKARESHERYKQEPESPRRPVISALYKHLGDLVSRPVNQEPDRTELAQQPLPHRKKVRYQIRNDQYKRRHEKGKADPEHAVP